MKWRLKSILIPCLQNQAYITDVSVICLFLLKYMHALSVKGKCSGCNSPWTSIILDFPTGWSSMQRGHFQCTKTKIIMTITQTCGLCTPACWERKILQGFTIVWIQIPNHYSEQFTKWWCKKSNCITSRELSSIAQNHECTFEHKGYTGSKPRSEAQRKQVLGSTGSLTLAVNQRNLLDFDWSKLKKHLKNDMKRFSPLLYYRKHLVLLLEPPFINFQHFSTQHLKVRIAEMEMER